MTIATRISVMTMLCTKVRASTRALLALQIGHPETPVAMFCGEIILARTAARGVGGREQQRIEMQLTRGDHL